MQVVAYDLRDLVDVREQVLASASPGEVFFYSVGVACQQVRIEHGLDSAAGLTSGNETTPRRSVERDRLGAALDV